MYISSFHLVMRENINIYIYVYMYICLPERDARMPVQIGICGTGSWSQINSMWGTCSGECFDDISVLLDNWFPEG